MRIVIGEDLKDVFKIIGFSTLFLCVGFIVGYICNYYIFPDPDLSRVLKGDSYVRYFIIFTLYGIGMIIFFAFFALFLFLIAFAILEFFLFLKKNIKIELKNKK